MFISLTSKALCFFLPVDRAQTIVIHSLHQFILNILDYGGLFLQILHLFINTTKFIAKNVLDLLSTPHDFGILLPFDAILNVLFFIDYLLGLLTYLLKCGYLINFCTICYFCFYICIILLIK